VSRLVGSEMCIRDRFNRMNSSIEQNKIKPVIDKVFKFENSLDAFAHMAKGNHFGKICISM
jgi:NADPH:quinone reductase-like Zn-dependent oxidoreductase